MVDRHYESKFHLWIIEAFPKFNFQPRDFLLHIGADGQICDSKEELVIHNFLITNLRNAKIRREPKRFINTLFNETYIPDWVIEQGGKKYIVEYFGLYKCSYYPDYTNKVERKISFYEGLTGYTTVAIYPQEFKEAGFSGLRELLRSFQLDLEETNKHELEPKYN